MDNYYKLRTEQVIDHKGYKNFDLPGSFENELFVSHLNQLLAYEEVKIPLYNFNCDHSDNIITIQPAPIIIIEGLFIYHIDTIKSLLNYKVMVRLSYEEAFRRRLKRDQEERNYRIEEITHRYNHHAEPAYLEFIKPYMEEMDLVVDESQGYETCTSILYEHINSVLKG